MPILRPKLGKSAGGNAAQPTSGSSSHSGEIVLAFWLTTLGVLGMGLAFGVAGVLQTYLERIQGQPYMVAQQPIRFWMAIVAAHGLMVVAGAVLVVKHLLTLRPATAAAEAAVTPG